MLKRSLAVLLCLCVIALSAVAQTKKPAAKKASAGAAPDKAYLQKIWDGWSTLNPANTAQVMLGLQGQAGVPYVIQSSTNLVSWSPVSTNTPTGSMLSITNPVAAPVPAQFWRAVWQP